MRATSHVPVWASHAVPSSQTSGTTSISAQHPAQSHPIVERKVHASFDAAPHVEFAHGLAQLEGGADGGKGGGGRKPHAVWTAAKPQPGTPEPSAPHSAHRTSQVVLASCHCVRPPQPPANSHSPVVAFQAVPLEHAVGRASKSPQHPAQSHPIVARKLHESFEAAPHVEPAHGLAHAVGRDGGAGGAGGSGGGGRGRGRVGGATGTGGDGGATGTLHIQNWRAAAIVTSTAFAHRGSDW